MWYHTTCVEAPAFAWRLAILVEPVKTKACSHIARLGFIEPQLLTLTDHPPLGSDWIHEVKHDGYRTLLIIEGREARAYTRNGFDWSES
jgi:ATP-dependent DNA ligase